MGLEELKVECQRLEKLIAGHQRKIDELLESEDVSEFIYYDTMKENFEAELKDATIEEIDEIKRKIESCQKHIDKLLEIDEVSEYSYHYEYYKGYEQQLVIMEKQLKIIEKAGFQNDSKMINREDDKDGKCMDFNTEGNSSYKESEDYSLEKKYKSVPVLTKNIYNNILLTIRNKFKEIKGKEKNYFIDDEGRIVATLANNIITMYYSVSSDIIWNHKNHIAVSIVKDFNVNNKVHDVMYINGLCGSTNDVKLIENYFIETYFNRELYYLPLNDLNILSKKNYFYTSINKAQNFGSCGNLIVDGNQIILDICGEFIIDNIDRHLISRTNNFDLFILSPSIQNQDLNYKEIYEYHKKRHNWYYNNGKRTAGSKEKRMFDERRKESTVDKVGYANARLIENDLIDQIYYSELPKSLNSKRLQMMYVLMNNYGYNKKQALDILNEYDFNIRNVDVKRLVKKK